MKFFVPIHTHIYHLHSGATRRRLHSTTTKINAQTLTLAYDSIFGIRTTAGSAYIKCHVTLIAYATAGRGRTHLSIPSPPMWQSSKDQKLINQPCRLRRSLKPGFGPKKGPQAPSIQFQKVAFTACRSHDVSLQVGLAVANLRPPRGKSRSVLFADVLLIACPLKFTCRSRRAVFRTTMEICVI